MKPLALLFILVFPFHVKAQNSWARPSIQFDARMPLNTGNPSFRATMDGIVYANVHGQLRLFNKVFGGIGAGIYFGRVDDVSLGQNMLSNGSMTAWIPHIQLSYEDAISENVMVGGYVKTGYAFAGFSSNYCNGSTNGWPTQQALMIEPGFTGMLIAQDNVAVSLKTGYSLIFADYGPAQLCLPFFSGFEDEDSEGIYQYFSIGFGFSLFLGKVKGSFDRFD